MKKLLLVLISISFTPFLYGQNITDALRYSQTNIEGTARFRALSGAFGALGGDMSAIGLNPAGSAVFNKSMGSATLSISNIENATYFGDTKSLEDSDFDLDQAGAVFIFKNYDEDDPWKKFTIGVTYDKLRDYDDEWIASGAGGNSISDYFSEYAQGKRLDQISRLGEETYTQAYSEIGNIYGFDHQQAFLGYESYIIDPDVNIDSNTSYSNNALDTGNPDNSIFNQEYKHISTGYNGKMSFNLAAQYEENLFLGINLNSHFIDYDRYTLLLENNNNNGSLIKAIDFENRLSVTGSGFSFQLGGILKVTNNMRLGLTYDSPTWLTIREKTTQYVKASFPGGILINEGELDEDTISEQYVAPQIVTVFPEYTVKSPGKTTASIAYVFGKRGLLSFDYSTKDYGSTKLKPSSDFYDENDFIGNTLTRAATYRIGGEYRYKEFSFRGGYRLEESPYKNETTIGDLTGFSLGLGYNFGNTKLDIAYEYSKQDYEHQLYNRGLTDSASINTTNSNISLTLGFNLF